MAIHCSKFFCWKMLLNNLIDTINYCNGLSYRFFHDERKCRSIFSPRRIGLLISCQMCRIDGWCHRFANPHGYVKRSDSSFSKITWLIVAFDVFALTVHRVQSHRNMIAENVGVSDRNVYTYRRWKKKKMNIVCTDDVRVRGLLKLPSALPIIISLFRAKSKNITESIFSFCIM